MKAAQFPHVCHGYVRFQGFDQLHSANQRAAVGWSATKRWELASHTFGASPNGLFEVYRQPHHRSISVVFFRHGVLPSIFHMSTCDWLILVGASVVSLEGSAVQLAKDGPHPSMDDWQHPLAHVGDGQASMEAGG